MIAPRYTRKEQEQRIVRLAAAQDQPHRNIAKGESLLDTRLESPLGRLVFKGIITPAQYDAGLAFRRIALIYLQSIYAPYPFVESPTPDAVGGQMGHDFSDDKCYRFKKAYFELYDLLAPYRGVPEAMMSVVVYEQTSTNMEAVKRGLRVLAAYFDGKKRPIRPFGEFRPVRMV